MLVRLPNELIVCIINFCDPKTVYSLAKTCKLLKNMSDYVISKYNKGEYEIDLISVKIINEWILHGGKKYYRSSITNLSDADNFFIEPNIFNRIVSGGKYFMKNDVPVDIKIINDNEHWLLHQLNNEIDVKIKISKKNNSYYVTNRQPKFSKIHVSTPEFYFVGFSDARLTQIGYFYSKITKITCDVSAYKFLDGHLQIYFETSPYPRIFYIDDIVIP